MLPDQNNFFFCLYIFCFISFHSCRGVCCHLAFVATSYRMQHSKEKKYSIFTWKLESDFQRKGTKSCLPKSKSLQAHTARAMQRAHVKPCQSWAEELPRSSLFLSLFLLVSPPFIPPHRKDVELWGLFPTLWLSASGSPIHNEGFQNRMTATNSCS